MTQPNRSLSRMGGVLRSHQPAGLRIDTEPASFDYLPLIQKLVELRREQSAGVMAAFTAAKRHQGVTYVVESLAWQLAHHTGESILLTTGTDLVDAARSSFWEPQRIQRLNGSPRQSVFVTPDWADLQFLRARFGFILLDCPCLRQSSEALALSKLVDGVALVVAAGESRREEIESVQNAFEAAGATLLGLVLNKQTNPVPRLLAKLL